jgi:hypothetical protein
MSAASKSRIRDYPTPPGSGEGISLPVAGIKIGNRHRRDLCLAAADLTDWQREFLRTLATYVHRPSSRQLDILKAITEQVLAGNAP